MDRPATSFITQRIKKKQNTSELLYQVLSRVDSVLGCAGGAIAVHDIAPASSSMVLVYPSDTAGSESACSQMEGLILSCSEIRNRMVLSSRSMQDLGLQFDSIGGLLLGVVEPIIVDQEIEGILLAVRGEQSKFSAAEYEILQLFAQQAGMIIENAILISAVQDRAVRVLQMNHLTNTALRAGDQESLLRVLTEGMADLVHADECLIVLWDEDREEALPVSASGSQRDIFPQEKLSLSDQEIVRSVLSASRSYLFEDFSSSTFDHENSILFRSARSGVVLPLITGHRWLGAIFLNFLDRRVFQEDEIQLCEQAASQAVLALAKTQAFEAEQQRNAELEALRQANLSITSSLDLSQVLDTILAQTMNMVDAEDAHIFLLDGGQLTFGAARWVGERQPEPFKTPRGDGLTSSVAHSGRRIVVEEVNRHPMFQKWKWGGAIIGLPIRAGKQVLGVMNVAYDQPHKFSSAEIRVLELMADQAAIALENANLFRRMDAERRRVSFLYDVAREVGSDLSLDHTIKQATGRIAGNLNAYSGIGLIYSSEMQSLRPSCMFERGLGDVQSLNMPRRIGLGDGIEGWVAQERSCAVLDDFRSDDRWKDFGIGIPPEVKAILSVPLVSGDDLFGVISVMSEEPFDQSQIEMVQAVSHQVGLALSNAASYQSIQQKLNERQLLQQIAQAVNRNTELEPLLKEVVDQIADLLKLELVEIFLRDGELLRLRSASAEISECHTVINMQEGIVGKAARTEMPVFSEDVRSDPDYLAGLESTQSEIAVPLRRADEVIGVLNIESDRSRRLYMDDLRLLTLVSDQIAVAIERAELYERLRDQAFQLEELVAERTSELENALEQAKQADKIKSQFVADVSHELRTPLTNIQLYLELLTMGSQEKVDEYLDTLHRETGRLTTLIESLLAISRLDNDSVSMQFVKQDLNAVVMRLVQDRTRLFSEKGVDLSFDPKEGLPDVTADEGTLSQVIANLMTNALQYTPIGGSVRLATRACEEEGGGKRVCLDIADTGVGIDEEEQDQLFTRFFRGSASRRMKTSGTGLGLAICSEILQRHKGGISVRSQLDQGSVFTIWLPVSN